MTKHLFIFILSLFLGISGYSQIASVGLIGSATPNGWDSEIPMTQVNDSTWTLHTTLIKGEVKFRANNNWDVNWGFTDFPTGVGIQGGPNIPVFAGTYDISFNSKSGAYVFVVESPVGIIGDATPTGWDSDTNMFKDTSAHGYFVDITLKVGGAKFRLNDAWTRNWGSNSFPTGTGTQGGDNIPIPKAGKYHVTFDTLSGAYNFTEKVAYQFISLIGDGTAGGWSTDTDLKQDVNKPEIWKLDVALLNGSVKFRADHAWTVNWGGTTFPTGVGIAGGDNIPVTQGNYRVTFNTDTKEYNFQLIEDYNFISLIGNAVPGGENWDKDLDLTKSTEDPTVWKGTYELVTGEVKFRANHAWDVNWGSGDFPSGVGEQGGANIPVTAGRYKITFNTLSGAYNFEAFVVYDKVSIVGKNGPFGQWPSNDDGGANDAYLTISPENDQVWTGTNISLTNADTTVGDSGIKFRANTAWTVNWGSRAFPSGVGTQDGQNIWCKEGSWDVVFNTLTGDYVFTPHSATHDIFDPLTISLYPNPSTDVLNVDVTALKLMGEVVLKVYDISGKLMITQAKKADSLINIDISSLKTGNYLLNIISEKAIVGKQFSVSK